GAAAGAAGLLADWADATSVDAASRQKTAANNRLAFMSVPPVNRAPVRVAWRMLLSRLRRVVGRSSAQTHVADLVEQSPIADLQELGRLGPVPTGLLEDSADRLPLGVARRLPGHVLQRGHQPRALPGRVVEDSLGLPRRRLRADEGGVPEHDHALHEV